MLIRSSSVCCHARMCDSKGTQNYACLECRPAHKRSSAAEMARGALRKRSTHAGFRRNVQPAAANEPLREQASNDFGPSSMVFTYRNDGPAVTLRGGLDDSQRA